MIRNEAQFDSLLGGVVEGRLLAQQHESASQLVC
jgi:hypothetical protein